MCSSSIETAASSRTVYRAILSSFRLNGSVCQILCEGIIVSTFGPEGPTKCSGLDVMRYDAEGAKAFGKSCGIGSVAAGRLSPNVAARP